MAGNFEGSALNEGGHDVLGSSEVKSGSKSLDDERFVKAVILEDSLLNEEGLT